MRTETIDWVYEPNSDDGYHLFQVKLINELCTSNIDDDYDDCSDYDPIDDDYSIEEKIIQITIVKASDSDEAMENALKVFGFKTSDELMNFHQAYDDGTLVISITDNLNDFDLDIQDILEEYI